MGKKLPVTNPSIMLVHKQAIVGLSQYPNLEDVHVCTVVKNKNLLIINI